MKWNKDSTFTIVALPSPHATKTAFRAFNRTGNVIVTRWGGGLGESVMDATQLLFSLKEYV